MRELLSGTKVRLNAIKESDIQIIENWFDQTQFLRFYDYLPALPKPRCEVRKYLESFLDSQERHIFAVRKTETDECIGIAGFDDIIWNHGVATLFIGIGDHQHRGMGYGKEALQLLLDFGFKELNFYRIQLNVISYNQAAIALYQSLGFIHEGTLRKFVLRDLQRYDLLIFSLMQTEWE